MVQTKLLAQGNPIDVGPNQQQLALLDLSPYRAIRLSAGNWELSAAPVVIAVSHVDKPNTPNANLITALDSFVLAPSESVSKVYEVPGEVMAFMATPDPPQASGISVFFTVYGRAG
jgi:hypothetical protein